MAKGNLKGAFWMKRDVFELYVLERLEDGMMAQEIIDEIDDMISRFGQLELNDGNKNPVVLKQFWLNNFSYKDFIKEKANTLYWLNSRGAVMRAYC